MDKKKWANDEEFKQVAWEQMAKVLDQEMPVEQKKNRALILFLSGIGVLVLASLVIYLINGRTNNVLETSPLTQSEQVQQNFEVPSSVETENHEKYKTAFNTDQLSKKTKSKNINAVKKSIKSTPKKTPLFAKADQQNSNNVVVSNHKTSKTTEQNSILGEDIHIRSAINNYNPPTTSVMRRSVGKPNADLKSLASLNLIPIKVDFLEINPINLDIPFTLVDNQTITASAFKPNFDFIIGGHLIATTDTEFYGYGAHLGIDYQFTQKFSMRSMVAHQKINAVTPYEDLGLSLDTTVPEGLGFADYDIDQISKYSETCHTINLTLGYHFNKHFSLFSGYQFRYFTGMRQEYLSDLITLSDEKINIFVDENTSSEPSASSPLGEGIFLREKKIFNPIVGINYRLKNIETSLIYEHGIKANYSNLISGETSNKLSYLQLNLSARF